MKITLNKPTIYQVGRVRLLPGDNDVSGKDVMRMLQNKIVQADIAAGVLTIEHEQEASKSAESKVDTVIEAEEVKESPKPVTVRRRRKKASE